MNTLRLLFSLICLLSTTVKSSLDTVNFHERPPLSKCIYRNETSKVFSSVNRIVSMLVSENEEIATRGLEAFKRFPFKYLYYKKIDRRIPLIEIVKDCPDEDVIDEVVERLDRFQERERLQFLRANQLENLDPDFENDSNEMLRQKMVAKFKYDFHDLITRGLRTEDERVITEKIVAISSLIDFLTHEYSNVPENERLCILVTIWRQADFELKNAGRAMSDAEFEAFEREVIKECDRLSLIRGEPIDDPGTDGNTETVQEFREDSEDDQVSLSGLKQMAWEAYEKIRDEAIMKAVENDEVNEESVANSSGEEHEHVDDDALSASYNSADHVNSSESEN